MEFPYSDKHIYHLSLCWWQSTMPLK